MKIETEDWSYKDWLKNVRENGHLIRKVPKEFLTNELCLAAVKSSGVALRYVPEEIRTSEICLAAIKKCGWGLERTPEEIKTPELCLAAVLAAKIRSYNFYFENVPEIFLKKEFCSKTIVFELYIKEFSDEDEIKKIFLTDQEFLVKYSIEELLTSPYVHLRELAKRTIRQECSTHLS